MKPDRDKKENREERAVFGKTVKVAAAGIALLAVFCLPALAGGADDGLPVRLTTIDAGGGQKLQLVRIDLTGGVMEVASAGAANYARREKFEVLAGNAKAVAAINGCYFDMKTGRLVGHVYSSGKKEVEGAFGAAFAVTADNRAVIAPIEKLGDKSKYRVIISCVDILMKAGKIDVKTKGDLVRNGHNPSHWNDIYKPARWSAIGIGSSGTVYLVATPGKMSIYRFVREVKEHTEIVDMLGLDGGSSSGLYYKGKVVVRPARTIASVIVARASGTLRNRIAARPAGGAHDSFDASLTW